MCGDGCSPHLPEVSRHYVIVVKCFASGQCSLQTGDPEVIFHHHTCCKDYGVRYDPLYWEITALILAATCIPLFHKFTSKWIASGWDLRSCCDPLRGSYVEIPAHCTCRHYGVVVKCLASGQCGPGLIPCRNRSWSRRLQYSKIVIYHFSLSRGLLSSMRILRDQNSAGRATFFSLHATIFSSRHRDVHHLLNHCFTSPPRTAVYFS